ncbi:MAG TPA: hypothetical protein VF254_02960 [Gammaproteobacteria bacterium]
MHMREMLKILLLGGLLALTGCGGGGSSPVGTTEPPPGNDDVLGNDEFRFAGKAPGVGPEAEVVIHLGGETFTAHTDSHETFEADVPLASLEEGSVVRFQVKGAGSHEHIEWHVAAPDAARLRELAGEDRTLTADEYIDLELSEMAVGRYARLFVENGRQHVTTNEQFQRLQRDTVDGNDVLASGAIKWLANNGRLALPVGYETTWEFLQDESIFDGSSNEAEAKNGARTVSDKVSGDELFDDGVIQVVLEDFAPFTVEDVPEEYLLTEISRSVLDLKGGLLRFNEDGTGEHITPAGTNTMTWRINDIGELVVTPEPGKLMSLVTLAELLIDNDNLATRTQEFVGDIVLRRLRGGEYADLLTMEYRIEEREVGDDGGFWPQTGIFLKAVTALRSDGAEPFSKDEIAGKTWAMPGLALGVTQTMEKAAQQIVPEFVKMRDEGLVTFHEDGTGHVHEDAVPFDWSIDVSGSLVLAFADENIVTYRKMRHDGVAYDLAVLQSDPGTGELYANGGMAIVVDESAAFEFETPVRLVRFGDLASRFDLQGFRANAAEMFDDHTVRLGPLGKEGVDGDREYKWSVTDEGDLIWEAIFRYVKSDIETHYDPNCDPSGEECLVLQRKLIQPLFRDGDRVYTLDTEIQYWYARKTHELYGVPATIKRSIAFWEPEEIPAEE